MEGAVGGLVAGVALTIVLGRLWLPRFDVLQLAALGALLVFLGIAVAIGVGGRLTEFRYVGF